MMHDLLVTPSPTTLSARLSTQRLSLSTIAYNAILEMIFESRVAAGAHLRIDALAAELRMSITPVREALARTAADGLTRLDDNRGYTVTPMLSLAEFHDLFAARRTIELAALRGPDPDHPAAWVERVSDDDLARLADLVDEMGTIGQDATGQDASYSNYSNFSLLDRSLHQRLVHLAGNRFLADAWDALHFHLHMSRLYAGSGVIDYDQAHAEHLRIVDALRQRDGALVVTASEEHATRAEDRLQPLLGAPGAG